MKSIVRDGIELVCFERLSEQARLVHAFTTRPLNMAPHRGEDRERAVENRLRVCAALGLAYERLTAASQIHGPDVLAVEEVDIGRGRDGRPGAVPYVDGLITDRVDVALLSLSADCVSLLAFDPVRKALGAAHASWRGTIGGIAANLVTQMGRCFGCRPEDLMVGIGPSAGPCCYEVKEDVRRVVATRAGDVERLVPRRDGRFWFDLWATIEGQFVGAGVAHDQIEQAGVCTMCDARFYSHRRDGAECGRFGLVCALR